VGLLFAARNSREGAKEADKSAARKCRNQYEQFADVKIRITLPRPRVWVTLPLQSAERFIRRRRICEMWEQVSMNSVTGSPAGDDIRAALIHIWRAVLNRESISERDNFFELGGDSVQGTNMVFDVEKQIGVEVPVEILFEKPAFCDFLEAVLQAKGLSQATVKREKGFL
jgi:acyl carrier protein